MDFWLPTAPSSAFVFPVGQAISRTTFATLFAAMGATFGPGDGTTTFNLPDKRSRVSATPDNMGGGTDPNRLTSGALASVRNSLGGGGGESAHTLTAAEIPQITSNVQTSGTLRGSTDGFAEPSGNSTTGGGAFPISSAEQQISVGVTVSGNMNGNAQSNNTGGQAHNVMQPTILCNYIIRII